MFDLRLLLWPIILDTYVNKAVSKQKQLSHFNNYCKVLKLIIHVPPRLINYSLNYQVHSVNICVAELIDGLVYYKKSTKFQEGFPPQFTQIIKNNQNSQFIHTIQLKRVIHHTQNMPSKHLICFFCHQYQLQCKLCFSNSAKLARYYTKLTCVSFPDLARSM